MPTKTFREKDFYTDWSKGCCRCYLLWSSSELKMTVKDNLRLFFQDSSNQELLDDVYGGYRKLECTDIFEYPPVLLEKTGHSCILLPFIFLRIFLEQADSGYGDTTSGAADRPRGDRNGMEQSSCYGSEERPKRKFRNIILYKAVNSFQNRNSPGPDQKIGARTIRRKTEISGDWPVISGDLPLIWWHWDWWHRGSIRQGSLCRGDSRGFSP